VEHKTQGGRGRREDWLPQSVREAGVDRRLKPGEFLFRLDARTLGLYVVREGSIKLVRPDPSGRETVLYVASAGDIVAEASLFSPAYHCDAIATTNAVVRLYPKGPLLSAFEQDAKAAQVFMAMLARQIMGLRTRLEQRNIHAARDRVRHYLALNVGADTRSVTLPGTLKDLASELGLAHEALYRTLAEMAADGEIERLTGRIELKTLPYDPDHTRPGEAGLHYKKKRMKRGE
jgi:CRP-like cAMP-binding protein